MEASGRGRAGEFVLVPSSEELRTLPVGFLVVRDELETLGEPGLAVREAGQVNLSVKCLDHTTKRTHKHIA